MSLQTHIFTQEHAHGPAIALWCCVTETLRSACDDRDDAMRADVLRYFNDHPHAMDTLEGVVEWWLPRHHLRITVDRVARALDALTHEGLVEQVQEGKRVLYRLRAGTTPQR